MDPDSFRDMVQERRSVRGYRKDPVPRDVIEEIIEIAGGALHEHPTLVFPRSYRRTP